MLIRKKKIIPFMLSVFTVLVLSICIFGPNINQTINVSSGVTIDTDEEYPDPNTGTDTDEEYPNPVVIN